VRVQFANQRFQVFDRFIHHGRVTTRTVTLRY
jgi:hypothetical protein